MKRVDTFIAQTLQLIKSKTNLKQPEQLDSLRPLLLTVAQPTKTKQQLYQECAEHIAKHVNLKQYQAQVLFDLLYSRFFQHYTLVQQCAILEQEQEAARLSAHKQLNKQISNSKQDQADNHDQRDEQSDKTNNCIIAYIEKPYIAAALSEAVEVQTKRGVELDHAYLD